MTNPPSVASQGSGGAQTYPKGILKKSVQAAFEGETPLFTSTNHLPPAPCLSESSKCACPSVLLCVCLVCLVSCLCLHWPAHGTVFAFSSPNLIVAANHLHGAMGTMNRLSPCATRSLPTLIDCFDIELRLTYTCACACTSDLSPIVTEFISTLSHTACCPRSMICEGPDGLIQVHAHTHD